MDWAEAGKIDNRPTSVIYSDLGNMVFGSWK
jgi:hypothetical protein